MAMTWIRKTQLYSKNYELQDNKDRGRCCRPVVNRGLTGGSGAGTLIGKEEAEAGDDWALDRGRCPGKEIDNPAASMEAW